MRTKKTSREATKRQRGSSKENTGGGPATQEQLWQLWEMLMATLLEMLRSQEQLSAEKLGVIRSFLRDNNISIDAAHEADVRESLVKLQSLSVPFDPAK